MSGITKSPEIARAVEAGAPEAERLVRYMYEHPETPKQEKLSSAAIVDVLKSAGFQVEYPFLSEVLGYDTAFRATLSCGDGPRAAILVEYDALPGLGHGCGHNLHGALSILAAVAMMNMKNQFHGTLHVIGTPAEEAEGAKVFMAQEGVFDGLDLAIMMHSSAGQASQADMDALGLRCYIITFHGAASHAAASPWDGRNALTAARKFLDLVDSRRETFRPYSVVNSVILEGGKSPNLVPEQAVVRLELRATAMSYLAELDRIIRNCAQGAALAMDCTVDFAKGFEDFYDMVRTPVLERRIEELFREYGEPVIPVAPPSGSSDVGNVSYRCPAVQPMLCITREDCALHTVSLREATLQPFAFEQMRKGASIICEVLLQVYGDGAFRGAVAADYQQAKIQKIGRS